MIVIEDFILQMQVFLDSGFEWKFAVLLYQHGKCSLCKTAAIVGVNWMDLQKFLGEKGVSVYTEEMFERDLEFTKNFRKKGE